MQIVFAILSMFLLENFCRFRLLLLACDVIKKCFLEESAFVHRKWTKYVE